VLGLSMLNRDMIFFISKISESLLVGIQIKKSCFGSWKSGDCFYWEYDDLHAFYNFSLKDRYAVQITGVIK